MIYITYQNKDWQSKRVWFANNEAEEIIWHNIKNILSDEATNILVFKE